jgi:hypothetical protein
MFYISKMSIANKILYQINILKQILNVVNDEECNSALEEIIDEYNVAIIDITDDTQGGIEHVVAQLNTETKISDLFVRLRKQHEKMITIDAWEYYKSQLTRHHSTLSRIQNLCNNCSNPLTEDVCETCGATSVTTQLVVPARQVTSSAKEHDNNFRKAINDLINDNTHNIHLEHMDMIKYAIVHNRRKLITSFTCDDVRNILKTLRLTKYNEKIPSIMRTVVNRHIILFTEHELAINEYLFKFASNIFDAEIRNDPKIARKNQIGKIFKIYKVAEATIEDSNRIEVLALYIHFPNVETLIRFDNTWKRTCEIMNNHGIQIKYKTTPYDRIR